MIEKLIASPYLYPLWRVGWLERGFFHACRLFKGVRQSAFLDINVGFDISKWQGVVDFLEMLAFGARFLILRCGYGIKIDERFEEYIAAAYGLLPLSVYHFYDPVFDPAAQAKKVIGILEPHRHKIKRVWLDLEFWWDGAYKDPKHWKIYRDTIKAAGYKIGWYTRATWWNSRVGAYAAEFAKDPLWAAQYNWILNLIPKGWLRTMVWQTGTPAIGIEAGVGSREIDRNLWNDELDFLSEWGSITPPPPPDPGPAPIEPQPEMQLWNARVLVNGLNVRKYPVVTDATKTGYVVNSWETFSGRLWVGNGYVWMLIDTTTRPEIVGRWVAVRTENGASKFITLTNAIPVPAPIPTPVHTFTVPDQGEFYVTKHDYQRADWNFKPRSFALNYKRNPPECALPETVYLPGCKPGDFVPLPREWQVFWFELLNLASEGTKTRAELLIAWESLTVQGRAFTDFHSTAYGFTDYILGKNLGSAKGPLQHKSITCAANMVEKVGVHSSGKLIIRALNLSETPPDPAVAIKDPCVIHWATQETVIRLPDGRWRVTRFDQLDPFGVPYPVVSATGTNLIEKEMVNPIANGATYSPYVL